MATSTDIVDSPTLSSSQPATEPRQPVVAKSPSLEAESAAQPETPTQARRESHISQVDPNAFKITILLASSGYRTQISINQSFLEKASVVEGDGFLVSQLKTAIWKDWPSGSPLVAPE